MPRAFLIKAKKEKKKEEEQSPHLEHQHGQLQNDVADPQSNEIVNSSRPEDRISPPTDPHLQPSSLHAKRKNSQSEAESDEREICVAPRLSQADVCVSNKNAAAEIPRAGNKGISRKTRKKNPRKSVVYYYEVAKELKEGRGEQLQGVSHDARSHRDVPHEGQGPRTTFSSHQRKHNYAAAANSKQVKSQGNPHGGYQFNPPTHSTRCQEKSTRFEYQKTIYRERPTQFNYAETSGARPPPV